MNRLFQETIKRFMTCLKSNSFAFVIFFGGIIVMSVSLTACDNTKSKVIIEESDTEEIDASVDEVQDILEADRPEEEIEGDATDVMSEEENVLDVNDEEIEVDGESAFDEQQHPFTFEDLYHNVYTGTIGDENVIVDIYPNMEDETVIIRYVGNNHEDTVEYIAEYPNEYSIIYHDDKLGIYLNEYEDGVLSGTYYIKGKDSVPIVLTLSHINYMTDPEKFYTVGKNKEIESFAKNVKEMIAQGDQKALSKLVSYPITLQYGDGTTFNNEAEFLLANIDNIITPELKEAIEGTYTKFMFCNAEGVMLGNGEYNIWFSYLEDGKIKIIAINN
jgi:hypothetical protein